MGHVCAGRIVFCVVLCPAMPVLDIEEHRNILHACRRVTHSFYTTPQHPRLHGGVVVGGTVLLVPPPALLTRHGALATAQLARIRVNCSNRNYARLEVLNSSRQYPREVNGMSTSNRCGFSKLFASIWGIFKSNYLLCLGIMVALVFISVAAVFGRITVGVWATGDNLNILAGINGNS